VSYNHRSKIYAEVENLIRETRRQAPRAPFPPEFYVTFLAENVGRVGAGVLDQKFNTQGEAGADLRQSLLGLIMMSVDMLRSLDDRDNVIVTSEPIIPVNKRPM